MKTNKELMEWVGKKKFTFSHPDIRGKFIYVQDVGKLFTGMKLVPEDSIVLSHEHAEIICTELFISGDPMAILTNAIQEAEGGK